MVTFETKVTMAEPMVRRAITDRIPFGWARPMPPTAPARAGGSDWSKPTSSTSRPLPDTTRSSPTGPAITPFAPPFPSYRARSGNATHPELDTAPADSSAANRDRPGFGVGWAKVSRHLGHSRDHDAVVDAAQRATLSVRADTTRATASAPGPLSIHGTTRPITPTTGSTGLDQRILMRSPLYDARVQGATCRSGHRDHN